MRELSGSQKNLTSIQYFCKPKITSEWKMNFVIFHYCVNKYQVLIITE